MTQLYTASNVVPNSKKSNQSSNLYTSIESTPIGQLTTDGNNNVWIEYSDGRKVFIKGRSGSWGTRGRAADQRDSDAHLGIYTNNFATIENIRVLRSQKFKLLNKIRPILKGERTAKCFYSRVDKNEPVGVFYNPERKSANYGNLARCGNLWGCPVCASIISENRKNESKKAMDWWQKEHNGSVLLLSLTAPHTSADDVKGLKKSLQKAYHSLMKGSRKGKDLFIRYGIQHYISVFEVTHGQNGFHPHFHVLLFMDYHVSDPKNSIMRDEFYAVWKDACLKAGLSEPSFDHGLDLRNGDQAAHYVSKWGLEHEMTKGHIKKGRNGSRTPFDLIRDYAETGDEKDARLFALYYFAFKGTRQLNWSQGLKKLSKNHEMTDQEIVNSTDKLAEWLFDLDIELWHAVRSQGMQAELLSKVEEDPSLVLAMEFVKECLLKNAHAVVIPDKKPLNWSLSEKQPRKPRSIDRRRGASTSRRERDSGVPELLNLEC